MPQDTTIGAPYAFTIVKEHSITQVPYTWLQDTEYGICHTLETLSRKIFESVSNTDAIVSITITRQP